MSVWQDHYTSNLIVALLVCAGVSIVWHSRSDPRWRRLVAVFARRKLALAASGLFAVFMGIALLDSVAWCDSVSETDAAALGVKAFKPRTIVDRCFPRDFDEKVYSGPLARQSFYGAKPLKYPGRHLLGTTIIGRDTLHETLKGFRPAMMIGVFTTLLVTPIALVMGVLAGYFGKRVDDAVQYLYSTLASIPRASALERR